MNSDRIHSITLEVFAPRRAKATNVITFYGEGQRPLDSLLSTLDVLHRHGARGLRGRAVITLIDGSTRRLPVTALDLVPLEIIAADPL